MSDKSRNYEAAYCHLAGGLRQIARQLVTYPSTGVFAHDKILDAVAASQRYGNLPAVTECSICRQYHESDDRHTSE